MEMEQTEQSFGGIERPAATALDAIEAEDQTEAFPLITEFLAVESESQPEELSPRPSDEPTEPSTPIPVAGGVAEHLVAQKAPDEVPPAQWIQQERDAFDWQGMATLAAGHNEEQRAAEEWASTDWDTSTLATDHVAAVLLKLAKRIQRGELRVDADRKMSAEAIVAAALSALLRSEA